MNASELRRLIDYDPETGIFVWKMRNVPDDFLSSRLCNSWNTNFSGKQAGCRKTDDYGNSYTFINVKGHIMNASRYAWLHHYGSLPDNQIDHINGDGNDNRISNLRDVTPAENMKNRSRYRSNRSGITGVYYDKGNQRWRAQIRVNSRCIYLGCFRLFDDALKARQAAEQTHGFHMNHGRAA